MMKILNSSSVFLIVALSLMINAGVVHAATVTTANVTVEDGHVRGLPPGQTVTAAFMRLLNHGDEPVTLVAASSDRSDKVEVHATRHSDNMMHMEKVDSIVIPAGGEFVFASGQYHLMLVDLVNPLRDGEMVDITLSFSNDSVLTVSLPVRSVLNEHMHKH